MPRIILSLTSLLFLFLTPASAQPKYAQSTVGDSENWTALKWTEQDIALFHGFPEYKNPEQHHLILLRYSFFVSLYDLDRRVPIWVAHVNRQDSLAKDHIRKGGNWDRSTDRFVPDRNVVAATSALREPDIGHWTLDFGPLTSKRPAFGNPSAPSSPLSMVRGPASAPPRWVTNDSYTNANPTTLPIDAKGYTRLTRGHLASNQEMKSLGTDAEGEISQTESFSLANVVPQMQHHNAPLWSTLELDCLEWAENFGGVAVISGPVYLPDPKLPPPVNRQLFTDGKDRVAMPIPTHFFKIIIARIHNGIAIIGFLIPHRADLNKEALSQFAVPVRTIEQAIGFNVMAILGANDAAEMAVDARWLGVPHEVDR
jgi:DNA/RNA endonuclease G (NUC1)